MGRLDIILPKELETKFRFAAFQRCGGKKGCIKKAVIEAIEEWLGQEGKA